MSRRARELALERFAANSRRQLNKSGQLVGIGLDLTIGLMTLDLHDWVSVLTSGQKTQGSLLDAGMANIEGSLKRYRAKMAKDFTEWVRVDKNHSKWEAHNPRSTLTSLTFEWRWIGERSKNADFEVQNDVRNYLNRWLDNELNTTQGERAAEVRTTGITYEHGSQREGDALNIPQMEPRRRNSEGATGRAGARNFRGTSSEARIIDALDFTGNIRNRNTTEVFRNYLIDYFGYDQTLLQNRSRDKFADSFVIQGRMTFDNRTSTMNPGTLDRIIQEDFERIFGSSSSEPNEYFKKIANKYIEDNLLNTTALDLWADSKNPKDDLIEAGIDSIVTSVVKANKRAKRLTTPYKSKKKTARSSTKNKKLKGRKRTTPKRSPKQRTKDTNNFGKDPIALKELINNLLPSKILPKMQSPALVNRTGRFRESAEVTNVLIGPRGGVQIDYTYQRNPYEVFEPGSGSPLANQYRDPRRIIGGTIREIAQQIMGKKFIKTRRV